LSELKSTLNTDLVATAHVRKWHAAPFAKEPPAWSAAGHKVTAIVRHPEKLEKRDGLTATVGDIYDTDSLASLIAGHDALISAFNPGWTPGAVKPEMYDEQVRGTSSIIAAARKAGIKRVLWVGGAGGLEVAPGVQLIDAPGFPEWIKPGSRATSDALEQLKKQPELNWSFLAPSAKLEPGQRTGNSD
jgi:putative NADH-flavin reductase